VSYLRQGRIRATGQRKAAEAGPGEGQETLREVKEPAKDSGPLRRNGGCGESCAETMTAQKPKSLSIRCPDCGADMPLQVCSSNAGYYVGRVCDNCGPFSRNGGYHKRYSAADRELHEFEEAENGNEA
jgi:hypothetical protein